MDLCFGQLSRKVAAQSDVDELWTTIVLKIPGLAPYRDELQMRYVDDEGDEILVTTNDELQEALRVGKETTSKMLVLQLVVPGMGASTQTAIESTAGLAETPTLASTATPVAAATATPAATTPDVLQILKNAGSSAVAELNSVLDTAATEIDTLFCQLGTASAKQKETEKQLEATKAALVKANSKCTAGVQQVSDLKEQLVAAQMQLAESMAQKKCDMVRLQILENQVAEAVEWEDKWKVAEEQRLHLDQQLQHLRSGLKFLSGSEPAATTAEVVSSEVVPPSPVLVAARSPKAVPVPSPELPPPYEEPAAGVPVANHNVFPVDTPAPSPMELKMQQLADMGFSLTFEQLREKLIEHSDNMQHVINSLL